MKSFREFFRKISRKHSKHDITKNPQFKNLPEDIQRELISFKEADIDFEKARHYVQQGIEAEGNNNIDKAILCYEKAAELKFVGSRPYNRLAIIYRNLKRYEDEEHILELAVSIFQNDVDKRRADISPKLKKFQNKLLDVNKILHRQ